MISDMMMVSKGITILAQMDMFNKDIREWRSQTTELKKLTNYKTFFHQANLEQRRVVTTAVKWGYTAEVQNIYGLQPTPTYEHHEAIGN